MISEKKREAFRKYRKKVGDNVPLIPRIECVYCGWYNNKPSRRMEKQTKCCKCGKPLMNKHDRFMLELGLLGIKAVQKEGGE